MYLHILRHVGVPPDVDLHARRLLTTSVAVTGHRVAPGSTTSVASTASIASIASVASTAPS